MLNISMTVGGLEGASTKQGMGAEEVAEGVDIPEMVSIRGYIDKARNEATGQVGDLTERRSTEVGVFALNKRSERDLGMRLSVLCCCVAVSIISNLD
jgi:hypothetical protein